MHLRDFEYSLPEGLIAQFPEKKRNHSRLMVLHRDTGDIEEKRFYDLKDYLKAGDLLILNDTKVFPARLMGRRKGGGRVEVLLLNSIKNGYKAGVNNCPLWKALIKSSKRPSPGEEVSFNGELKALIKEKSADGVWNVEFNYKGSIWDTLERIGETPLPPYIKRPKDDSSLEETLDRERYQTVFASQVGAVAAPTAGLHFTEELLDNLRSRGVRVLPITLHIGWGTFKPVRVENIRDHVMHPERYEIEANIAEAIMEAREKGSRIIAVGTSVVRILEYVFGSRNGKVAHKGYTDLFIYPGYEFKIVNALITNFHLPKSTLLMLISAFAGRDFIRSAYKRAIENRYRFYSYGDAMLII